MGDNVSKKVIAPENMGFARYMDFSRISALYSHLLGADKSQVDDKTRAYLNGATDALMTLVGSKTELSRLLELDASIDEIMEGVLENLRLRAEE